MLYSLMMCFLCSFRNQNNWPWTFTHRCHNGLADCEHTIHIANHNGSTLFSYFWLKVTMASTQNIEQTKHMTVMVGDALSETSYMLGVMMGRCGLNMHSLNFEARSDTQIQEHRLAWPVQKLLTFYDVKPNCKALIWIRRIRINHSVILDVTI